MLSFITKKYKCSTLHKESTLPPLSYQRKKPQMKSTISDFEGLFIGYGYRENSYPYAEQNLYSDEIEQDVTVAVLENEYMIAEFLVDFGGRLWKLWDKKHNRDVLYTNDVIRFRNLSVRNAWFSGGVEWNCGIIGHSPFTCARMNCAKVKGENGEEVLRFYEFERVRSLYYQMDFWLKDSTLMVVVRIENPNKEVVPMYWWSNMATPEFEGGRVIVPASSAYNNSDGMGIKKSKIPLDNGVDVSYPKYILDTIDYFYDINPESNKFIANVATDGYGLLQFSSHNLKGRKLFSWGHREGSNSWQRLLTDKAGDYVEIQAGIGKTQYECIPMPPKTSWSFVECYTLAQIDPALVAGAYEPLVEAVNAQVNKINSSTSLTKLCKEVEQSVSLQKGELLYKGSGFGYLQNALLQDAPKHLEFTKNEDAKLWINLLENGELTGGKISFAMGETMKGMLSKCTCRTNWIEPYQRALLAYDKRDIEKARHFTEKSLVIDNNYQNNHLYAAILYQLEDDSFSFFAKKALFVKADDYCVCESILRLLLQGECYCDVITAFDAIVPWIGKNPRLQMYLSMAHLKMGDADRAESILLADGGLRVLDFREGDRFLNNLYRGIRLMKYGEENCTVLTQFDFIVSKID